MWIFQDTFETHKQSFISAFSICMTGPWTLNFSCCPSDSASTFFKMASTDRNFLYDDDIHAVISIISCLDMLNNGNIMTVNASEVVQKVPTDEKDYHKCSLYVIVSI